MMCLCLGVKGILHYVQNDRVVVQNDRVDNPSEREGVETLPYDTREAVGGESKKQSLKREEQAPPLRHKGA